MGAMAPGATESDPLVGQRVGQRYRVTGRIARGSMGRVYEAEQEPLGRSVALKMLDVRAGEPNDEGQYRQRFLREASVLGKLTHPNTVRVYDYGAEDDHAWLAMELVRGESLSSLLRDGPIPAMRAVKIARQICGSLAEAHGLGLVHRDLKPANVLIERTSEGDDRVKVVDFGLVKQVEGADQLTAEGLMLGTPMFMSPEQIRGKKVDQRTDIYAMGILLYRALLGTYPFPEGNTASLLLAHMCDPPTDPREVDPTLPRCLRAVLARCLEKEPDDRFPTVLDLARALDACEASLRQEVTDEIALDIVAGRTGSFTRPPAPPRPQSRAISPMAWAALGAAFLVAAGLAMVLGFLAMRLLVGSLG